VYFNGSAGVDLANAYASIVRPRPSTKLTCDSKPKFALGAVDVQFASRLAVWFCRALGYPTLVPGQLHDDLNQLSNGQLMGRA
jgi:hypothetical protein